MRTISLFILCLFCAEALGAAETAPVVQPFAAPRDVPHGEFTTLTYTSKTIGCERKALIYTPPGYAQNADQKYPVLYLMHGSGDDENSWKTKGSAGTILDNLLSENKLVPMLVVMPYGYGLPPGKKITPASTTAEKTANRQQFVDDLLNDLMPQINSQHRVNGDREHTAIAGLSMGGSQALALGLGHLERFAWVACFSSLQRGPLADATVAALSQNTVDTNAKLKLLWISIGDKDKAHDAAKLFADNLLAHNIKVMWVEEKGGHEWPVWQRNLRDVAPLLFR